MKRIKLHAFFGTNLGDDLMVDILLKRYPQYRFYYDGTDECSDLFLEYPNFENRTPIIRKYGRLNYLMNLLSRHKNEDALIKKIFQKREKKSICGVLIGGSMFIQLKAKPERHVWWEELRFGELPRFVIGVNFGPYQTEDFKEAFKGYFSRSRGVTFRDRHSHGLFSNLDHAAYAPDVVLNLPVEQVQQENQGTVIISVIHVEERDHLAKWTEDYQNFIIDCCQESLRRGKQPVLMSFCKKEGDEAAICRIKERMDPALAEKTREFYYHGNIKEALSMFAGADYVVATRFHAMILALRFGKPFFSIAYSDKVKWVLDDVGSSAYCGMDQLHGLRAETVMDAHAQAVDAENYILQAQKQFAQLDDFLKKRGS